MSKKISIITTVFNCEKYIDRAINSVIRQTFPHEQIEWIIFDDGSTDETWEKINARFKGDVKCDNILVHYNENKGIPTRANEAILCAKGEYIAIQDADDESFPERLEEQLKFLENHKEIFACGSHAIKIDVNNNSIGSMIYPKVDHEDICKQFFLNKINPMIHPSVMYRKDIFLELGGYSLDKDIYTVMDMDLWAKAICSHKKLANLQRFLVSYRINPSGVTQTRKKEMIDAHMIVWNNYKEKKYDTFTRLG